MFFFTPIEKKNLNQLKMFTANPHYFSLPVNGKVNHCSLKKKESCENKMLVLNSNLSTFISHFMRMQFKPTKTIVPNSV